MPAQQNRRWHLAAHPRGMVQDRDFVLQDGPCPVPADGELLLRTLYLSVDPAMRGWITGRRTYVEGIQIGELIRGVGVAEVVASRHPEFAVGDRVVGSLGWQDFEISTGGGALPLTKIPIDEDPRLFLGPLGITGLTAYFGLLEIGQPRPGDWVLVSGAAGATGSVVGQIAKQKDCRVVGIAGGPEKCAWLVEEAGFDAAIDYRAEPVGEKIRALCRRGVDIFFDNVGGATLDAALANLARGARVVLCGAISTYNDDTPPPGPRNYLQLLTCRARMEGFIILDYAPRFGEALAELLPWVKSGAIRYRFDVVDGLENAPAALRRLFESKNVGKQLVRVAP